MRILRSMEAVSPLVETIAAMGVALALLYVYFENLPAAKFIALIGGIFLLYEPIKTLSRMHITMQRSIASTIGIFEVLEPESTVLRCPRRDRLERFPGPARLRARDLPLPRRRSRTR